MKKGAPIATLDDRDMRLERIRGRASTRNTQASIRRRSPTATGRRQIVQALYEQAYAQVQLLDEQLRRPRFSAPFDGVIVKGDLSQSLGAGVRKGDVLFEITPLTVYRVIVMSTSANRRGRAGQKGTLCCSSIASRGVSRSR